ncbi:MAG: ABC transporter permease [Clostridiales bacterium]|nr:ABC transporter permease [Clostridiales bacterium]
MKIRGWGKVLKFSFIQLVKTKSFIFSTILTILIINGILAASMILPTVFSDDDTSSTSVGDISNSTEGQDEQSSVIKKVYWYDETDISPAYDYKKFAQENNIEFVISDKGKDELIKDIEVSEKAELLITLSRDESGSFYIKAYRPYSESIITEDDSDFLLYNLSTDFKEFKYSTLGLTEEQIEFADSSININSYIAGKQKSEGALVMSTLLPMIISVALFMLIFTYGQMVAQSIATEKTSKVMELLLTSIRPLAVVVGKVLAMGLVALFQVITIGITVALTFFISGSVVKDIAPTPNISEITANVPDDIQTEITSAISETFTNLNPLSIIMVIVVFILGFFFFALISAIIGASISRLEDLAQANQPLVLIGILGFYLAYFSSGIFSDAENIKATTLQWVSWYLPISSPFALPSGILMGYLSIPQALLAIAFLAICVLLFALVVTKVYETLILHTGDRIKLIKIIKMAFTPKNKKIKTN